MLSAPRTPGRRALRRAARIKNKPDVKCRFEVHVCVFVPALILFCLCDQRLHAGYVVFQVTLERGEFLKLGIRLGELG